jgi:squalene-hopene/tetraprenyl-beta-curcumene cyclase
MERCAPLLPFLDCQDFQQALVKIVFSGLETSRLTGAFQRARKQLLASRVPAGHWIGELSSSALSTATAISALTLVRQQRMNCRAASKSSTIEGDESDYDEEQIGNLIAAGIAWLAERQNEDGGWGDTDKSYSNISTTMLAIAAFRLTGEAEERTELMRRASGFVESQGGVPGLRRRYGKDKTFAIPILANCAMAGMVPWKQVSALPFELACFPQAFYRFMRLPVVSYAIPALVAIGQARYYHKPPLNPIARVVRAASVKKTLRVLKTIQPASGGYLEAIPLTSFVVMSLASMGKSDLPVVRRAVDFIIASARPDGSWPIDTNLATWNTTLAVNALAGGGEDVARLECLDWLLSCQQLERHPFTGADPGGWAWSDLSGAVPDADDTPGALLALAAWRDAPSFPPHRRPILDQAARDGLGWLLGLQNRDGGWPTFCRGWGTLPFDRSGSDLTAHALRAIHVWRGLAEADSGSPAVGPTSSEFSRAVDRGFRFLTENQRLDGSWVPLWFGNQDHPDEENPIYGTAKVLMAYRDFDQNASNEAQRGLEWLRGSQNDDGGWGGGATIPTARPGAAGSSVEETALAVEALMMDVATDSTQKSVAKGLRWLIEAVESGAYLENSPIGFYFAKLWYHERLYPLVFTVAALGRAQTWSNQPSHQTSSTARLTC